MQKAAGGKEKRAPGVSSVVRGAGGDETGRRRGGSRGTQCCLLPIERWMLPKAER